MKTRTYLAVMITLLIGVGCNGQTPEQKKKVQEIEKMRAQAQRAADSILNTPEMKKMMEQAKEMGEAQKKANRKKDLVAEKKIAQKKANVEVNIDHLKDFTISKESSKKFDNWQFGAAELYVIKYLPFGKDSDTQYKVGSIGADGSFDFTMPENISCETKISDFYRCQHMGSTTPKTEYSNPNAAVGPSVVSVIQNGKRIGKISLATSKQQVYNFSPAHQFRGDLGYRLSWWYAEQPSSAKVICDRIYDNYGEQFEMRIIYKLEFKPGWNLVKTEVLEAHNPKFYKIQEHAVVPSPPSDAKWVFHEIRL